MPDRTQLKVGDKIRILSVPQADLDQRVEERKYGLEDAGWTADTIERIIAECLVVEIEEVELIDDTRLAWFSVEFLTDSENSPDIHWIAVMEDDSCEHA